MLNKLFINKLLYPALLTLTTILAFYNSSNNDFIKNWDDNKYVIDNELIQNTNPDKTYRIFTEYWMGHYHPITIMVYNFQYKLFGLNPKPYHIFSLLLHIINSILIYFIILKLFGSKEIAVLLSVIFAVHPMHVESVAWISSQKDLLYSFFFLSAFLIYLKFIKTKKYYLLVFVFILFILSSLSKSAAIIFPFVLLLTDYYINKVITKRDVIEKIPFLLISVVFGLLSVFAQKAPIINTPYFTIAERILLVIHAFSFYFIKFFIPINLSAIHYYPESGNLSIYFYLSVIPVILLIIGIIKLKIYRHLILFSIGFFLINCILILQIFPLGEAYLAERYTYMPYVGLSFLLVPFLQSKKRKYLILTIIIIGIISMIFITNSRVDKWKNGIILFSDIIQKYPDKAFAYYNRGLLYLNENKIPEAKTDFDKAVTLGMKHEAVFFNRGTANLYLNNYNDAIKDFDIALKYDSCHALSYYNKGLAFAYQKNYETALKNFSKAMKCDSSMIFIYYDIANAYFGLKNFKLSIKNFKTAINHQINIGNSYYMLGMSYYYISKIDSACFYWNKAYNNGYSQALGAIKANCFTKSN